MTGATVHVLRTLIFADGTTHHEERTHAWPGYTAAQAYGNRAARLKEAKADATYDHASRSITHRIDAGEYVEVETMQFDEEAGHA